MTKQKPDRDKTPDDMIEDVDYALTHLARRLGNPKTDRPVVLRTIDKYLDRRLLLMECRRRDMIFDQSQK